LIATPSIYRQKRRLIFDIIIANLPEKSRYALALQRRSNSPDYGQAVPLLTISWCEATRPL